MKASIGPRGSAVFRPRRLPRSQIWHYARSLSRLSSFAKQPSGASNRIGPTAEATNVSVSVHGEVEIGRRGSASARKLLDKQRLMPCKAGMEIASKRGGG